MKLKSGLADKNGTDICEGDICEMNVLGSNPSKHARIAGRVLIEFKNAAFGFTHIFPHLVHEDDRCWRSFWDSEDLELWNPKYIRVLGNKYENPELLEEPITI